MLKAIHPQESRLAAEAKVLAVIEELIRQKLSKAAELIEEHVGETLIYYEFPDIRWIKLRTNNPLERIMRETADKARGGSLPRWLIMLEPCCGQVARYCGGAQWTTRCYMTTAPLKKAKMTTYGAAVAWSNVRKILDTTPPKAS